MRRFAYDFTATVSVDGVVRDHRTIWAHQQDDPCPGGHRYEVVLAGRGAIEHLEGLPLDAKERLNGRRAHQFLQLICWALEVPEEGISWEFVLNTIDSVHTENDTVRISGECSPFVRNPQ